MSGRRVIKQKMFAALPVLAAAFFVLSSCASSSSDVATSSEPTPSDSTILDDGAKVPATDVADTNAFSDLEPAKDKKDAPSSAAAPAADGDTYYSSVGGETLRRIALTLYSDKALSSKLLEKNPDLKGVKKLGAEQKVFFDMDAVRPEPRYLTKDLINRYAEPLAQRLNSEVTEKGMAKTTVTINKGESLQDVSQRLYGTHRYWTEIYLVNRDKIQNYDKVTPGLTLSVVDHPNTGVAKAAGDATVAKTEAPAEEVNQSPPTETKPLPAISPVGVLPIQAESPAPTQAEPPVAIQPTPTPTPMDPIPETPSPAPIAEKAPPPPAPAAAEAPKPLPTATHLDQPEPASANSSLRRILFVLLILGIGGAAFYFTRTPKRAKVDMLDLNADAGRPKLAPKDSQKSNIG